MSVKGLRERLRDGENVVCAEGYMWELERRGFVCCGAFTPEVVVDYPERVRAISEEFAMAGSDIIEAYTAYLSALKYYGHREKLKSIGREHDLESLNKTSLQIARQIADARGCLMAGNICNTNCYDSSDPQTIAKCEAIFKEQVEWAVQGQADMMIAETFSILEEAKLALESIKKYGRGMPAVVTLAIYVHDHTFEGTSIPEALRELELMGADVVGLNCSRGPETMLPVLREAKKICKGPLAAIPVPFRTEEANKSFHTLRDPKSGEFLFPTNLACVQCSRADIRKFAQDALDLGIRYIGLCCGSYPSLLREVAQVYGRKTVLDKYSPDPSKNSFLQKGREAKGSKIRDFYYGGQI